MLFLKNDINLFDFCKGFNFPIRHVMEVGVATPDECRSREFILAGTRVTLIEPIPEYYGKLTVSFGSFRHVGIHNIAIGEFSGKSVMYWNGSSSFLGCVDAPPTVTDGGFDRKRGRKLTVNVDIIDNYDDGTVDILLLDMEGAEWYALSRLKSRPWIVAVETHHESRYTNPHIDKINTWLNQNVYKVLFRNTTDSYFIRGDDFGWGPGGNDGWNLGGKLNAA